MDTQKLKAAWKARNDKLKAPVKVELTGVGEPLYVRLLKADEGEHIAALRESAQKDEGGRLLAIVGMLCHEDGRRLTSQESQDMFDMLTESPPALSDWQRLVDAATGADEAGNSPSASPS